MKNAPGRVVIPILVGVTSYFAVFHVPMVGDGDKLGSPSLFWAPGLIFGIAVLAPRVSGAIRRVGMVLASTAIYSSAAFIAGLSFFLSWQLAPILLVGSASALGAVSLGAIAGAVINSPLNVERVLMGGATAGTAGAIFAFALLTLPDPSLSSRLAWLLFFVSWQAGFSYFHLGQSSSFAA